MDDGKTQFARLVKLMGWDKSETARQLHMTPSAVNHLLNPNRPTQPSGPTLQLLRLMAMGAHPEAFDHRTDKLKERHSSREDMVLREDYPTAAEREMLAALRQAPPEDQQRIIAMVHTFLQTPRSLNHLQKAKGKR